MARLTSINIHGVERPLQARVETLGGTCWFTLYCGPMPEPDVTFFFHPSLLPYFTALAAAINAQAEHSNAEA